MHPRARSRRAPARVLLAGLALLALPAAAAEVYVPLLNPISNDGSRSDTEVWVSNSSAGTATFVPVVLAADSDGTQRPSPPGGSAVAAGRSFQLTNMAQNGKYGLLALDLAAGLSADARIVTTTPGGARVIARVPVVSTANALAAGAKGQLLALDRDPDAGKLVDLGVVNVARANASCTVTFIATDGTQIAPSTTVNVKPLSLAHFHDALGLVNVGRVAAVRAEVSCNQPFYPYAALFQWPSSHYLFITPSVVGAGSSGGTTTPPPSSGTSIVFEKTGVLHTATVSNPKGILAVPVEKALSLRRLVIDMDVVPGPWNREKIPGNHGMLWLYRGKFRSNTVANVNAFGPNKYTVKCNQNVDLGAGQITSGEGGLEFLQGRKYHLHYTYDAEHSVVTLEVTAGGELLRKLTFAGTASGKILTIPASGMVAEFGHYYGQEGPEVASPGWAYYDLKIEMVPY